MHFPKNTAPATIDHRGFRAIESMTLSPIRVSKQILALDAGAFLTLAAFSFAGHGSAIFWAEWLTFNFLALLLLLGHHPAPRSFDDFAPGGADSGALGAYDYSDEYHNYADNPRYFKDAKGGPLSEKEIEQALIDFSGYVRDIASRVAIGLSATAPAPYIDSEELDYMDELMRAAAKIMKNWVPGPDSQCLKGFLDGVLKLRGRTIYNREHRKAYDAAAYAEQMQLAAGRSGRIADDHGGEGEVIDTPAPAGRSDLDFTSATLSAAIKNLAKDEQKFVDMRFFDGCMTLETIATKLGLSVGKAYSKQLRITAKLKEYIEAVSG